MTGSNGARPHKYAGKTPASVRRQKANLQPLAAVRHGAYAAEHLKPERERVLGELLQSFPSVRPDRLELLAAQRARIVLLEAYVEAVGIVRHRGHGTTYPAVTLLQREESAYRNELTRVEELQRQAEGGTAGQTLADIEAESDEMDDVELVEARARS